MRENRPIRRHHLTFLSQKEKGLKVILSFFHSLSCSSSVSSLLLLCLSLLFFFVFLFSLIFARSFVIHLVGELHGHWRDLYMMVFFISWLFSHFISSYFSLPVKLAPPLLLRHRRPRYPRGSLVSRCHAPIAPGRHANLCGGFSYCSAVLGARSSRVVSTLMPKCGLDQVTLTRFKPNPKKCTKKKQQQLLFTSCFYTCTHFFRFGPSSFCKVFNKMEMLFMLRLLIH